MNWEVHHYWLRVQDPELNRDEWVQFVVHPSSDWCRIMVRYNSNGTPGPILSNWKGTVDQGRTLWEHYLRHQMGVEVKERRETRQGREGLDDMRQCNPLDRLDA